MSIPPAPSLLVATAITPTRVDLTWQNNAGYSRIRIHRNVGGAGYDLYDIIAGSKEYWADMDCQAETSYCYKIMAVRLHPEVEVSDFSNEDCATTFKAVDDPTDIVATPISDIEIDVIFKDNSDEETGHRLERKLGTGSWSFVVELEPNREFFRDGGLFLLAAGYTDCVPEDIGKQVQDDGGEIGLLVAYDNIRRRWLIDSNGHTIADAESMTITEGTGAGTAARATTGLVKDSLYTYKVQASAGTPSDWDEAAQVVTFDIPSAPTLATILAADIKDKSIRIRWSGEVEGQWETATLYHVNDLVENNGSFYICILEHTSDAAKEPGIGVSWITYWEAVTGYRIEQEKTAELPFEADEADLIAVVGAGVTDFLAEGLDVNTAYSFRVRAYNAAGNGTFSATKAATTDAVYVPTEFENWIRNPNIEPVYLAEIYTKMTLETFSLTTDQTYTYEKTIGASDRGIDILEVFEGLENTDPTLSTYIPYVKKTSIATVEATASSFWFDYNSRILYIHTSDGTDPDLAKFLIEGAFWLYFSTHKGIEFTANGRLQHFLPLLAKEDIPDITQEIKPYFEGSFSISSGSMAFMNTKIMGEHFFDKKFATYTWINAKVILKAGRDTFTYVQFKEIFTAHISVKACSDKKITFQLRDIREDMGNKIVLNKFNTTDYPGVEKKFKDKPMPIYFGGQELVTPICIDEVDEKFKCNDGRIKSIETVHRNGAKLVEDVHYFVDLQRSIITFNRDGKFIIETGVNDKIDFKEGEGSELNITLTAGTYTTAELCAEIKAKMEAANALTFTVTCSSEPEKKFTIAATGEFSLLWKTGVNGSDNTDKHVGDTIGFYDDEDDVGAESYEADEDVIAITKHDSIEVYLTGIVNSADEVFTNGAEIFKYLMNNYKGLEDSELNLDSIYEAKYANENELAISIESEISFDEIVRTIEHSIEAYTFQDALGRLGIRPKQTTIASNAKYIVSNHIFDHFQKKDKSSLYWKVIIYYNKNLQTDDWESKEAVNDKIYWRYDTEEELPIYTYFSAPAHAQSLATSILNLLNKEQIEDELPMLLFDVMPGDLVKFSRTRFYNSSGTASEITLRIIKIAKSPASGKTTTIMEVV